MRSRLQLTTKPDVLMPIFWDQHGRLPQAVLWRDLHLCSITCLPVLLPHTHTHAQSMKCCKYAIYLRDEHVRESPAIPSLRQGFWFSIIFFSTPYFCRNNFTEIDVSLYVLHYIKGQPSPFSHSSKVAISIILTTVNHLSSWVVLCSLYKGHSLGCLKYIIILS